MARNLLFAVFVFSFIPLSSKEATGQEIDGARYIIVTPDEFEEIVRPLAEWKTLKGMYTLVLPLSETGLTAYEIKGYVTNLYNSWTVQPEYILLAGDQTIIPMEYVEGTLSDSYYGNMDGDFFNEILPGRFPAQSAEQLENMVQKTLYYERWPYMDETDWFTMSSIAVNRDYDDDDYGVYFRDAEEIKGMMEADGFVVDLFRSDEDSYWDLMTAVNEGRSFVLFIGVIGGSCNWASSFAFDPTILFNDQMLPIVVAATCQTMASTYYTCVGEKWVRAGDEGLMKGSPVYLGMTTNCSGCAEWRSKIRMGFFRYIFEETEGSIPTFGGASEAGRLNYHAAYGSRSEYYGANSWGDPELNIWTGVPQVSDLSFPEEIYINGDNVEIWVYRDSLPFENALVCLTDGAGIYHYGYTDGEGAVAFFVDMESEGSLYLTVTGRNLYPQETMIEAIEEPVGDDDDDTTAGDDDSTAGDGDGGPLNFGTGGCSCLGPPEE